MAKLVVNDVSSAYELKRVKTKQIVLNEISKILDISKGTVKSRLSRAREKLKNIIKEENDE